MVDDWDVFQPYQKLYRYRVPKHIYGTSFLAKPFYLNRELKQHGLSLWEFQMGTL